MDPAASSVAAELWRPPHHHLASGPQHEASSVVTAADLGNCGRSGGGSSRRRPRRERDAPPEEEPARLASTSGAAAAGSGSGGRDSVGLWLFSFPPRAALAVIRIGLVVLGVGYSLWEVGLRHRESCSSGKRAAVICSSVPSGLPLLVLGGGASQLVCSIRTRKSGSAVSCRSDSTALRILNCCLAG